MSVDQTPRVDPQADANLDSPLPEIVGGPVAEGHSYDGYTLLELLLAITILGVFFGLTVSSRSCMGATRSTRLEQEARAQLAAEQIEQVMAELATDEKPGAE